MYSFVRTGNCAIRIEKSPRLRIIIRQTADNPGRFGARAERVSAPAPNTSDFPLTCPVFYLSDRTGKILTLSNFLFPCFPPIFSFVLAFFQSIAHICIPVFQVSKKEATMLRPTLDSRYIPLLQFFFQLFDIGL